MEKLQYISPIVLYMMCHVPGKTYTICMAFSGSWVVTIVKKVFSLFTDGLSYKILQLEYEALSFWFILK